MALDRIEIDWGDDGYGHDDADVTDKFLSYSVSFGMDGGADRRRLVNRAASGKLVLDNEDDQFSADIAGSLGQPLRRRHACRITSVYGAQNERVMWEGFALPAQVDVRSGADRAEISLQGRLWAPYREEIVVDADFEATAHWHVENLFDEIGGAYLFTHNPATGPVSHDGTVLELLDGLASYSGAWGLEDRCGYFAMYAYLRLGELTSVISLDADTHEILHGPSRVWDRSPLVRNAMKVGDETFDIAESVAIYGIQEQAVPAFWPDVPDIYALNGLAWLRTWLAARAKPLRYAEITLPRDQANRRGIERIEPGALFGLRIGEADGINVDGNFWCCGCTLEQGFSERAYLHVQAVQADLTDDVAGFVLGKSRLGHGRLGDGS